MAAKQSRYAINNQRTPCVRWVQVLGQIPAGCSKNSWVGLRKEAPDYNVIDGGAVRSRSIVTG